jgi:tocopherol cyclase
LNRLWNPELFQGTHKTKDYFEGWYYKLISKDRSFVYAIIPGIALGSGSSDAGDDRHAFIQVINGKTGHVNYFRFPFESFSFKMDHFFVRIGDNVFTENFIKLNLSDESLTIEGTLEFYDRIPFPKSFASPGIMGPYSFVPGMECYHGIITVNHRIRGILKIDQTPADFSEGEGYLEKDYGKSFPSAWIWLQANHFDAKGTCFMFSIAEIPWLGKSFIGLISFLLYEGKLYRFASYNGSRIVKPSLDNGHLQAELKNNHHTLTFQAETSIGGLLKAPKNGMMSREIRESITATVKTSLYDRHGRLIFQGESNYCGMELSEGCEKLL